MTRRETTVAERLTDVALVLATFAALHLLAGAVTAFVIDYPDGRLPLWAASAAGSALECFAAACLLHFGGGSRRTLARAVIVTELVMVAVLILLAAVTESDFVFDTRYGYGLAFAASLFLAVGGLVISLRSPELPGPVADA